MSRKLKQALALFLMVFTVLSGQAIYSFFHSTEVVHAQTGRRIQPGDAAFQFNNSQYMATLPHSLNRKADVPFALPSGNIFSEPEANRYGPVIIDMNGDGLSDLVYSFGDTDLYSQAVALNTGDGFNLVYYCAHYVVLNPDGTAQMLNGKNVVHYFGDCAA